jgi:heme exporter protein B
MNVLLAVLWKDLVTEWRSRDRVVAMLLFSMLVVLIFNFALPEGTNRTTQPLAPGLLWIASLFAAILGLNRAFSLELENDAITGLALVPCDRGWVFLGKAIANFLFLLVVQVATAGIFVLVFELDTSGIWLRALGLLALGSLGICAVGTLFSAIAVRTRFREVMLPLLLLPLLVPVLYGAVRTTHDLLLLGTVPWPPLQLLLVADAIYLLASFVGFEFVLDE